MVDPHSVRERVGVGKTGQIECQHKGIEVFEIGDGKASEKNGTVARRLPEQALFSALQPLDEIGGACLGRGVPIDEWKVGARVNLLCGQSFDLNVHSLSFCVREGAGGRIRSVRRSSCLGGIPLRVSV